MDFITKSGQDEILPLKDKCYQTSHNIKKYIYYVGNFMMIILQIIGIKKD